MGKESECCMGWRYMGRQDGTDQAQAERDKRESAPFCVLTGVRDSRVSSSLQGTQQAFSSLVSLVSLCVTARPCDCEEIPNWNKYDVGVYMHWIQESYNFHKK